MSKRSGNFAEHGDSTKGVIFYWLKFKKERFGKKKKKTFGGIYRKR